MFNALEKRFGDLIPNVDFCSLRVLDERSEELRVRQDVVQPVTQGADVGAMVTVAHKGGLGYAATADLSSAGLRTAIDQACTWAERTRDHSVFDFSSVAMPHPTGAYESTVEEPWQSVTVSDKLDLLRRISSSLKRSDKIVDWEAGLWRVHNRSLYLTNGQGRVQQDFEFLSPRISVTANDGSDTQIRSAGAHDNSQQGGLEVLRRIGFEERAAALGEEALALLEAPNCPTGKMALLLTPDQMMLQIHESIGHPLELDRILGDERNYAGTTFVTSDMFGSYRYGSDLLNVCFDPSRVEQFASYGYDDEGNTAEKEFIIQDGILQRPLGSVISQARAGMSGTANARASSWNRPPIDRMANLNVEPGETSMDKLIASIERGVLMRTNRSWSIDDSRNKFQFGCEWGQLIEDGQLKGVVKNPNYRGISATFWRNLAAVGDESTFEVYGTPWCGKGEPNQIIRVGHASPACVFDNVDIFGGV
jgi:predicted Zn-dependent protease